MPVISGAGGPFLLYFKLCGLAAVVFTSPYWLYQIWAFILPGLHPHERRWSRVFASIAGPLFLIGVVVGYLTLPKGLEVLIGFTPDNFTNLVEFQDYLTFFSRTLLVFGIAFEIPVFIVLLNLAGVVTGKWLGEHRAWIILGVFVFAAVVTPSTDPFTMCFMAGPMVVLFFVSEVIARVNDRRRARDRDGASWGRPRRRERPRGPRPLRPARLAGRGRRDLGAAGPASPAAPWSGGGSPTASSPLAVRPAGRRRGLPGARRRRRLPPAQPPGLAARPGPPGRPRRPPDPRRARTRRSPPTRSSTRSTGSRGRSGAAPDHYAVLLRLGERTGG